MSQWRTILLSDDGELVAVLDEAPIQVDWSPDGAFLVADVDDTLTLWSGATGKVVIRYPRPEPLSHMVWSTDSTRLALASSDGTVRIWPGSLRSALLRGCEVLEGSAGAIELDVETNDICATHRAVHALWHR
jgi:WD40 repeat protein